MTATTATSADRLLEEFDAAWRDGTPVFGCCRKSVAVAVENVDIATLTPQDATARVQALREAVEAEQPGHLSTHRCCAGHLADLAFDLPDLVAPVSPDAD